MRTALLELTVSKKQEIVYTFEVDGAPQAVAGPPVAEAEGLTPSSPVSSTPTPPTVIG